MRADVAEAVGRPPSPFSTAARPAAVRDVTSAWGAALDRASEELAGSKESAAPSQPQADALEKLSELLLGYALRQMTPAQSKSETGLAFDTWRGMLADAVAHEVAQHVPLLPKIAVYGMGGR